MKNAIIVAATALAAISFVLAYASFSPAQIFRWVDENGRTVFSDTPPPAQAEAAVVDLAPEQAGIEAPPVELAAKSGRNHRVPRVELFITRWCPHCKEAIAYLRSRRIPFRLRDIETSEMAARRMERLGGGPGVPFAIINGEKITGFSEGAYERALGLD